MRIVPILLAVIAGIVAYFLFIDRDSLVTFLNRFSPEVTETAQGDTDVSESTDAATPEIISVLVRRSTQQAVDSAVILRGQTEAARQVDVRAETTSTIISEPLRKGATVEPGQLLCQLDPGTRGAVLDEARARVAEAEASQAEAESRVPEARARLTEAEARLDEALTNQNVARRLSEDGFAAETRVKNADASVASAQASVEAARSGLSSAQSGIRSAAAAIESARAAVASAETEISRLEIRAPFGGLLESDAAELGSLVQAGDICATVIQLDPIKLVAFAPETEVGRIAVGAPAGARLASTGGRVAGQVTFLSRSADPTTRTFRVEIEVPNKDLAVSDGQTVEIAVSADGIDAHLLPSSALTLDDEGRLGLRLVDEDGLVSFNQVSIVRDTVDGVWLSGLPPTANVIVRGQEFVSAGVRAAPTFQEVTQ